MGTLTTTDAHASGSLSVQNGQTTLLSNASVTALDRTAPITLARGGEVLVCSTSEAHLLHSGAGNALLFGLDRGALEIIGPTQPQDVVLTPDMRFSVVAPGTFDLSVRVTPDGDTCVDNAGPHAPVLLLSDPFSDATYRLLPGQHVLFERGSLHSVVDHERSPCGCGPTNATPAQRAALEHRFPEAQSLGLGAAPEPALAPTTVGLSADATTRKHRGFFSSIGHFFSRLFSGS
jgi:hypothetical protein